jgi:FKBP-type peptidyl-prolyl cis-trans isomerase 2|tara:strand:- start:1469 stop:2545 length:1077 start_codon:yes stop_codon:yes gene_type:complete
MFFKKLNPVFILKLKRIICWSCYPILVLSFLNSCKDQEDYIEEVYDYEAFEVTVFEQLENAGIDSSVVTKASIGLDTYYYYPITTNLSGIGQEEGNILSVKYQLSILGGDTIAFYRVDSETYTLGQGMNALIPVGLDYAISQSGIRVGEEYSYILPPGLAYGDLDLGDFQTIIPKNSILNVQIKLESLGALFDVPATQSLEINEYINDTGLNDTSVWSGNDGFIYRSSSSRLVMKVLDSSYSISPVEGNTVSLSYVLYDLNDSSVVIDRRTVADPFVFTLGVDEVMPGLDEAVRKMHLNETSLILLTSDQAYRESAAVLPNYEGLRQVLVDLQVIPDYAAAIEPFQILRFEASIEKID